MRVVITQDRPKAATLTRYYQTSVVNNDGYELHVTAVPKDCLYISAEEFDEIAHYLWRLVLDLDRVRQASKHSLVDEVLIRLSNSIHDGSHRSSAEEGIAIRKFVFALRDTKIAVEASPLTAYSLQDLINQATKALEVDHGAIFLWGPFGLLLLLPARSFIRALSAGIEFNVRKFMGVPESWVSPESKTALAQIRARKKRKTTEK